MLKKASNNLSSYTNVWMEDLFKMFLLSYLHGLNNIISNL